MKEGTQRGEKKRGRRARESGGGEKIAGMQEVSQFVSSEILFLGKVCSAPLPLPSSLAASLHSPISPSSLSVQSFLFIASLVCSHDGGGCAIPDMQQRGIGEGELVWSCGGLSGQMERAHERAIRTRGREEGGRGGGLEGRRRRSARSQAGKCGGSVESLALGNVEFGMLAVSEGGSMESFHGGVAARELIHLQPPASSHASLLGAD